MLTSQERGSWRGAEQYPYWILLTEIKATRTRAIQTAYRIAEAKHPRDDAPKAGAIRNLGLLDKDEDTKAVLGSK